VLVAGIVSRVAASFDESVETRGRPRLRSDDEILHAALLAFAKDGYQGMSLRTLNSDMGLSRGTINQRFGSKEQLWYAAVDHGFQALIDDINTELADQRAPADELSELRAFFRAFLKASARHPELVRLMNHEGLHPTDRLDHIMSRFTFPAMDKPLQAMSRLATAGRLRMVPARTLHSLLAHGAAAPFTLGPLSATFDPIDGPLDTAVHIDLVTDIIMRGLST
jgi:AcrR family transcriptional regulator